MFKDVEDRGQGEAKVGGKKPLQLDEKLVMDPGIQGVDFVPPDEGGEEITMVDGMTVTESIPSEEITMSGGVKDLDAEAKARVGDEEGGLEINL